MHSICPEVNIAVNLAIDSGNEVNEISEGWDKAKQVISMRKKLDPMLKDKIIAEIGRLRYWEYEGSPHDEPDEGFTCDECKVVLTFPVARKIIR